jgi:hypothetical protein
MKRPWQASGRIMFQFPISLYFCRYTFDTLLTSIRFQLATWLVDAGCSVILTGRSEPSPVAQLALNALNSGRKDSVILELGDVTDKKFIDKIFESNKIGGWLKILYSILFQFNELFRLLSDLSAIQQR